MNGAKVNQETIAGELVAAGVGGLPFSWQEDGSLLNTDQLTPAQLAAVEAVFAAHVGLP